MIARDAILAAALAGVAACTGCGSGSPGSAAAGVRAQPARRAPPVAPSPTGGNAATAQTVGPETAVPTTVPPAAAAAAQSLPPRDSAGVIEASFDDIKFPMEKTDPFSRALLTPKVNAMFGQKIRIRGYMYPTLRRQGLKQFVLVRDNMECCFGPGAALFDCILVTMSDGKTAEFSIRPIAVEGQFRLEELMGPEGRPLAIYQMVGDAVE